MNGPCVKQTVTAVLVSPSGARFVGTNECRNPQEVCPRGDLPTGEGYHLCKEVCDQVGHAEIVVLKKAGAHAKGATLYVRGHTYACNTCKAAARLAGVREIVIGEPPAC